MRLFFKLNLVVYKDVRLYIPLLTILLLMRVSIIEVDVDGVIARSDSTRFLTREQEAYCGRIIVVDPEPFKSIVLGDEF